MLEFIVVLQVMQVLHFLTFGCRQQNVRNIIIGQLWMQAVSVCQAVQSAILVTAGLHVWIAGVVLIGAVRIFEISN